MTSQRDREIKKLREKTGMSHQAAHNIVVSKEDLTPDMFSSNKGGSPQEDQNSTPTLKVGQYVLFYARRSDYADSDKMVPFLNVGFIFQWDEKEGTCIVKDSRELYWIFNSEQLYLLEPVGNLPRLL